MRTDAEGLVIKESRVGESDRLVTVLTKQKGVLRAFVQRAEKAKSGKLAATRLFSYSRFTIFEGRDKYIIDDAQPMEIFFGLRKDIETLSLGQYFCELAGELAPEGTEAGSFLRLMLNALYILEKGTRQPLVVKAAAEMRMLSMAGYMPNLMCCCGCGVYEADEMYFLPFEGKIICGSCAEDMLQAGQAFPLSRGAMTALRHTIYADFEKLFNFRLPSGALCELSRASEAYVLHTLGKNLKTLEFYHAMAGK
jgi:DNA repair protein RecO (recombination protein O)